MRIKVKIEGLSPLLMNKFAPVDGNGSSPVFRGEESDLRKEAAKKLYADEKGNLFIPAPNIFSCLIEGGKFHKMGKSKVTTMKTSLIPAGIAIEEAECPLGTKKWDVDTRAVVNPMTGGRRLCNRPRLDKWSLTFHLDVDETMFPVELVEKIVSDAGRRIGLGDFRPQRKGPFGRFGVVEFQEVG